MGGGLPATNFACTSSWLAIEVTWTASPFVLRQSASSLVRSYPSQAMIWSSPPTAARAGSEDSLNRNAPAPRPVIPARAALLLIAVVNRFSRISSPALRVTVNPHFFDDGHEILLYRILDTIIT